MFPEENKIWHYASASGERLGPISIEDLRKLTTQGAINSKTLVWAPQYSDWIPADQISDLLCAASPPLAKSSDPLVPITPMPSQELKPRKGLFLLPKFIGALILATVIGGIASAVLVGLGQSPWFGGLAFLLIFLLGLVSAFAAYRKEHYELHPSRMVCHRGGLFSDEATELDLRNITHVKVTLPWLRYKFFRVGDVFVQTAGTSKPMVMRAINDPEAVFSGMRERMKYNGYDLTQRELLHEEKPALIGAIVECIGLLGLGSIGIPILLAQIAGGISQIDFSNNSAFPAIAGGAGIIALIGGIIFLILHFIDMRKRTYRVFNDVVVYKEGFLTRHNAFIPYENIADSNTKRTLVDQILGLFDVHISCQGSSAEIKFRRLRNGHNLSDAIDRLVSAAAKKPKANTFSEAVDSVAKRPRKAEPDAVPSENFRMAEYRIHAVRLLVPQLLLLPLFPLWIIAMLKSLILLSSTRYFVRPDSIRHSYKFLRVDEREFSYDKITGLVIKRNLWDKWFGTMTLKFWSIGSGQALEFAHVHSGHVDLPSLMRQVGIPSASEDPCETVAHFQLSTWLRSRIRTAIGLVAFSAAVVAAAIFTEEPRIYAALAIPILIFGGGLIYANLYFSRQRLRFHEHHVEAQQGVIAKSTFYVRYRNVKRITSTRYPGGEEGALKIYVAGEEQVYAQQAQPKGRTPMMRQCSFTSGMLPQTETTGRLLDDILAGRVDPSADAKPAERSEIFLESKRSVGTAVMVLVLVSILLFPLVVLLPITIPLVIIRVKRWRYRIDENRVVVSSGVLFKKETSVLFDRVDSLQQSQGPLNKMFGNGKVSIMTAGSSKPDLLLIDSPDYLKLNEEIRRRSQ